MSTAEQQAINRALTETLAETLETMAFICPEPMDALSPDDPGANLQRVLVAFGGERGCGMLELTAPGRFGSALIAGLVDDDESITETVENSPLANDAFMELANVTCGLLLRKFSWIAPGRHMTLSLPVIESAQGEVAAQWLADCQNEGAVAFSADEGWIAARVSFAVM